MYAEREDATMRYAAIERWAPLPLLTALLLLAIHADMGLVQWIRETPVLVACLTGILVAALPSPHGWNRLLGLITLGSSVAAAIVWWPLLRLLVRHTRGPAAVQIAETTVTRGIGFLLVLIVFSLALLCGWLVMGRRHPWPVAIMLGAAFLVRADVTRIYEERFGLVVFGVAALVFLTRAPRPFSRLMLVPCALGAVLVAGAWSLPTSSMPWTHPTLSPVISLAQDGGVGPSPTMLSLQGPFHASNAPLMSVTINRPDVRPYWREVVYDLYDGHSWRMSAMASQTSPAGTSLQVGPPVARSALLSARVQLEHGMSSLVAPGPLVRSSVATEAAYNSNDPQPLTAQSTEPLQAGSTYTVQSTPFPTWEPLSPASFLQLPRMSLAVRRLAHRLTVNAPTPLQRALHIQRYLRDSGIFRYDAGTGSPADVDAVTAFLFQLHRGYCNQFATAMIALARTIGIPARLVSGYDTGTWTGHGFLVRARDAHSWVEAYIGGTGWLTFDPTPGSALDPRLAGTAGGFSRLPARPRSAIPRGTPRTGVNIRQGRSAQYQQLNHRKPGTNGLDGESWIADVVLVVLLILAAGIVTYAWRPRSLPELYRAMIMAAPRPYRDVETWETPLEFALRFVPKTADVVSPYGDVQLIADLYMRQTYARIEPSPEELREARRAWGRLRRRWSPAGVLLHAFRGVNDRGEAWGRAH